MARRVQIIESSNERKSPEWDGFNSGDPVKVTGERGEFSFRFAWLSPDGTAVDSICVLGGQKGHQAFRYFAPERVKKVPKRRQRKSSASEDSSD
jgi:hypothetical protein